MSAQGKVLVTGGAGYIGSHTVVELLSHGWEVVVLDDFSNSKPTILERIRTVAGADFAFFEGDVGDRLTLAGIFGRYKIAAVVHFAGSKAVGESLKMPLAYYRNNVGGALTLLGAMREGGCRNFVFSSSANVYGEPAQVPVREDSPLSASSPYGRTKLMIEEICRDLAASEPRWRMALLRYFNPAGAHPSGLLGEAPQGNPNNLMPYLLDVAAGRRPFLEVFGRDYPTPDGSGVRDFLHVVDLARGHVAALEALPGIEGAEAFNLGSGRGHSVLEMIHAMSRTVGHPIPWQIGPRRSGDIACCYADPSKAHRILRWSAELDLDAICQDGWNWRQKGGLL